MNTSVHTTSQAQVVPFFENKSSESSRCVRSGVRYVEAQRANPAQERIKLLTGEARRAYAEGLSLIPIPYGSKNPNRKDWSQERYTLDEIIRLIETYNGCSTSITFPVDDN